MNGMTALFLFVLFFGLLVLVICYSRNKKISLPGIFFFYWIAFSICGILFFSDTIEIDLLSLIWIFSSIFCFFIGYRIFGAGREKQFANGDANKIDEFGSLTKRTNSRFNSKMLRKRIAKVIFVSFLIILIIKVLTFVFALVTSGVNLFSFQAIYNFSRNVKYGLENRAGLGIIGRLIDLAFYLLIVLSGYFIRFLDKKNRIKILLLLVLNTALFVLSDGAKATLIFVGVMFFVGFLFDSIFNKKRFVIKIRGIYVLAALAIFFVLLSMLGNNINSFKVYAFGHIPAFSTFFNEFNGTLTYGKQTFYGFVKLFNSSLMFEGKHDNYPVMSQYSLVYTNIFTAFRCSITDFGYVGSFFFYFIFGSVCGLSIKRKNIVGEMIISWAIGYVLLSFLISIGYFFSISVALLLFPIAKNRIIARKTQVKKVYRRTNTLINDCNLQKI